MNMHIEKRKIVLILISNKYINFPCLYTNIPGNNFFKKTFFKKTVISRFVQRSYQDCALTRSVKLYLT